jgi:hypothetical protein
MKLFSLTTLAAALALTVPMMASAETSLKASSYTDTLNFALGYAGSAANNYFDLAPGNAEKYNVVVDASWTDMTYWSEKGLTSVDLVNELTGYAFKYTGNGLLDLPTQKGLLKHLTGTTNSDQGMQLTFAGLSKGHYTIKFTGYWDEVDDLAGKKSDWGSYGGTTDLTIKSVKLVSSVPEPESYAMLLAGLGLVGTIVARRRKSLNQA